MAVFRVSGLSFCHWQLFENKVASLSINGGKNKGKWNFTAKGKEELWFNSTASVVRAAAQANQPTNRYASQHEEIESSFYYQECKFPTSLRLELEKLSLFR
ncbi:hypothetical protein NC653_023093 [Populus alba x Populus x berolinensis]|uniref:Uncharacterized protein n=1 Tax=Populus alba x Populus x berolinensis TaxID=444605 RepID=A0AAD6MHP6_9ROSI|nr:hypothetical protein NC653_023093 [Populus alba x Populus x berolinensis]